MSDLPPKQLPVSLAKVKSLFPNRKESYKIISRIYRLPDYTSKAITKNYLKNLIIEPCPVFRIEHKDFHPPFVPSKHVTALEILEAIELLLKQKKYPPTGFDYLTLPDIPWLIGVYFFYHQKTKWGYFPNQ